MPRRPLLLIEQEPVAPAGHIADWLTRRGIERHLVSASNGDPLPDPAGFSGVIALGSRRSAYDDHVAWVRDELSHLRRAVESEVPVLGICFGGQALARTLGASVAPAPDTEIGWLDIGSRRPELLASGPWFTWHSDQFALPAGATLLARNHHSVQAFCHGPHLGVQFHPEVTPRIIVGWLELARRQGAIADADADAARRRIPELYGRARQQALALFDAWYDGALPRGELEPGGGESGSSRR